MIPAEAMRDWITHATEAYPEESVGYCSNGQYYRMINVAEDKERDFAVANSEAGQAFAMGIDFLLHSHTKDQRCPSAEDVKRQYEMAVPWGVIVIGVDSADVKVPVDTFFFGDQLPPEPYIGRTFRHNVHDCYMLGRQFLKDQGVVELPPGFADWGWEERDEDVFMQNFERLGFVKIGEKDIQPNDVILMGIGSAGKSVKVNHIGIYLGKGLMLHHRYGKRSRHDPVQTYRDTILGYLRYAK